MSRWYFGIWLSLIGLSFVLLFAASQGQIPNHPITYFGAGLSQGVAWVFFVLHSRWMKTKVRVGRR